MHNLKIMLVLVALAVAASAAPAAAQIPACKAEIEKLCTGIAPGGGRIVKCLQSHESELSDGCKAVLAKLRSVTPAMGKGGGSWWGVCEADVQKYCSTVEIGEGRMAKCLKQHGSQLTKECKTTLERQTKPKK